MCVLYILILMIVYYVIILILTQITRINIMYYTVNDKILIRLNPLYSCCSNVARCDFLNVFFLNISISQKDQVQSLKN